MTEERLTDLPNYRLGPDEGDIRGWHLLDREGNPAGIIEDLLVDTETHTARGVVVNVDGHDFDVKVPIGALMLNEAKQQAAVACTREELRAMPRIKMWHSRERALLRATFFPQLADAPIIGELEADDVRIFSSKEPRVGRIDEQLQRQGGEGI